MKVVWGNSTTVPSSGLAVGEQGHLGLLKASVSRVKCDNPSWPLPAAWSPSLTLQGTHPASLTLRLHGLQNPSCEGSNLSISQAQSEVGTRHTAHPVNPGYNVRYPRQGCLMFQVAFGRALPARAARLPPRCGFSF